MPASPASPAANTLRPTRFAAPVETAELYAVPLDAVLESVFVTRALPVAEAPVEASTELVLDIVPGSVAVALLPPESRSRPAVIVTGSRLSDVSVMTSVDVPGKATNVPASVPAQVAV